MCSFSQTLPVYSYKIIFNAHIFMGWSLTGLLVSNPSCSKDLLPSGVFPGCCLCVLKVKSLKSVCSVPLSCHPMAAYFLGHSTVSSLWTHRFFARLVVAISSLAVRRALFYHSCTTAVTKAWEDIRFGDPNSPKHSWDKAITTKDIF